jgi:PIN domain nuclease of toxin-antitoxin system
LSCFADACALVVYLGAGGRGMSHAGLHAMAQRPLISSITVWELRHKAALGKLPPLPLVNGSFVQHLAGLGFQMEVFDGNDAEAAATLPPHHRDPMDRMLIASAMRRNLPIITCDTVFGAYGVATLW